MSPLCAKSRCFSAHALEPIGFLHWVQVGLLDEAPDVIDTGVGRVLPRRMDSKKRMLDKSSPDLLDLQRHIL